MEPRSYVTLIKHLIENETESRSGELYPSEAFFLLLEGHPLYVVLQWCAANKVYRKFLEIKKNSDDSFLINKKDISNNPYYCLESKATFLRVIENFRNFDTESGIVYYMEDPSKFLRETEVIRD